MDTENKFTKEMYRKILVNSIKSTLEYLEPPCSLDSVPILMSNLYKLYEQLYKLDNGIV